MYINVVQPSGSTTYQGIRYDENKKKCCTQQYRCNSPQAINRQNSQLALRRGAARTASNLFTPLRHRLSPFYHHLPQSDVWVRKSITHKKKVSVSGATAFRLPRHQPPAPRPTLLSCAKAAAICSSDLLDGSCVFCSVDSVLCRRVSGALFKN